MSTSGSCPSLVKGEFSTLIHPALNVCSSFLCNFSLFQTLTRENLDLGVWSQQQENVQNRQGMSDIYISPWKLNHMFLFKLHQHLCWPSSPKALKSLYFQADIFLSVFYVFGTFFFHLEIFAFLQFRSCHISETSSFEHFPCCILTCSEQLTFAFPQTAPVISGNVQCLSESSFCLANVHLNFSLTKSYEIFNLDRSRDWSLYRDLSLPLFWLLFWLLLVSWTWISPCLTV